MIGTFLYLTWCGLVNRTRRRLRRLREPRYLIGAIVGGLYFYSIFLRRRGGMPTALFVSAPSLAPIQFLGSLAILVILALSWVWPSTRTGIVFARAEVQFLFPAPIARRQLLRYKVLKSAFGTFLASAILAIVFRPGTLATQWMFLTGLWLLFALLGLYFTGVSLSRASLAQHGLSGWRRQWVAVAVIAGVVGVLTRAVVADVPTLERLETGPQVLHEMIALTAHGAAGWVLWPFRAIVSLPLATSVAGYLHALPVVLALIVLNDVWVMRSDTAFEEASAEQAEKVATRGARPRRVRAGSRAGPFTLAPAGRPEIAIFWKNLLLLGRYASVRMLIRLVALVVLAGVIASRSHGGVADALPVLGLVLAGITVFFGPQIVRNDLRQDLERLDVLKTWPIRGSSLLAGELLAPAAVLTAFAWICCLAGVVGIDRVLPDITMVDRTSYLVAGLVLAPALILAQLVVQNAIAVLFPAWVAIGAARARGIDAMGQRMILMAGIWLSLILALLPAGLLAAAVGALIYLATQELPVAVPAVVMALGMVAEVALAIYLLGAILDRTDVGAIDATN